MSKGSGTTRRINSGVKSAASPMEAVQTTPSVVASNTTTKSNAFPGRAIDSQELRSINDTGSLLRVFSKAVGDSGTIINAKSIRGRRNEYLATVHVDGNQFTAKSVSEILKSRMRYSISVMDYQYRERDGKGGYDIIFEVYP